MFDRRRFLQAFAALGAARAVPALAQPQWKLGIRFLWGKRPYFNYTFARELDTKYQLLEKCTGYYCSGSWDYVGIQSGLMQHNAIKEAPHAQSKKHTGSFRKSLTVLGFISLFHGNSLFDYCTS